jgi:chromosome segregation ATPase
MTTEINTIELMSLKNELKTLSTDMAQIDVLVDRLDTTIEKLAEVSTGVSRLLAVHEQRIEHQEKMAVQLYDMLEKRREESLRNTDILNSKMTLVIKDLSKEISDSHDDTMEHVEKIENKLAKVEKFIWSLGGGGLILGFVLSKYINLAPIIGAN